MTKEGLVGALQNAHEAACDKFDEEKKERGRKRSERSAPKPESSARSAHELVSEANAHTDAAIIELKKLLEVSEDNVGTYAKGLLSQALKNVAAANEKMVKLDERLTALEDYVMRQRPESTVDEDQQRLGFELGKALGKALGTSTN